MVLLASARRAPTIATVVVFVGQRRCWRIVLGRHTPLLGTAISRSVVCVMLAIAALLVSFRNVLPVLILSVAMGMRLVATVLAAALVIIPLACANALWVSLVTAAPTRSRWFDDEAMWLLLLLYCTCTECTVLYFLLASLFGVPVFNGCLIVIVLGVGFVSS